MKVSQAIKLLQAMDPNSVLTVCDYDGSDHHDRLVKNIEEVSANSIDFGEKLKGNQFIKRRVANDHRYVKFEWRD